MKIAICDNEPLYLNTLAKQVQSVEGVESVALYSDYRVFLEDSSKNFDLVFMDIDWETEKNGIDIAAKVNVDHPATRIIFVTSYIDKYIDEVFLQKTNIRGILNKPVKQDMLEIYLQKIKKELAEDQKKFLQVKENNRRITLPVSEILYLESQNHLVKIVTIKNEYHIYEPLGELQKRLPINFCRCHRGFIINMNHIKEMGKKEILLYDSIMIPIGRSCRGDLETQYVEHLKRKL